MAAQEFLLSVGLIAAVMAVLAGVEFAAPLFARGPESEGRRAANFALTAVTLALNWATSSAAALLALVFDGRGLLAPLALPAPLLVVFSVAALDLSTYLAHRSMHVLPLLWRAHRVHHSDPFLDVSTTLRQHPLESLWRFLWIVVPTWALGLPAAGVMFYRLLSVLQAVAEHANIRVWQPLDRALSLFWVTPNMHKVHHSQVRAETDSNYGNLLSLFDRGLRTFTPGERAFHVSYGLEDVPAERAKSFVQLMALPFRTKRRRRLENPTRTPGHGGANGNRTDPRVA